MSSLFNLGGVIGAFKSTPKFRTDYNSPELNDLYSGSILPMLKSNAAGDQSDLAKYAAAISASQPGQQNLANEDISNLSNLIKQYGSYDPLATRTSIREGDLGSLNNQFTNLVNYGSGQDKSNAALLGYGGKASSGLYGKVADSLRASRNLTPILSQIYGNLDSGTTAINNDRLSNLSAQLGLMGSRASRQDAVDSRLLDPALARAGITAGDIGNAAAAGQGIKNNIAGFTQNRTGLDKWADAIGAADKSLNSAVDTGLSLYSGGLVGGGGSGGASGGLGGLLGGMGGGGGNQGGVNLNQLLQLASLIRGGSNVSPNNRVPYGAYDPSNPD